MVLSKDQKRKLRGKLRGAKQFLKHGIKNSNVVVSTTNYSNKVSTAAVDQKEPLVLSFQYQLTPLSATFLQDAMTLFEDNMGALYKKSSWGLNLEEKRHELSHKSAQFLLVVQKNMEDHEELIGYCHFRFENDDDDDPTDVVFYVYELQVTSKYQHCGIGRQLMERAHDIARKAGLNKVMLTVFNTNEAALRFYTVLGYEIDEISPSKSGQPLDYEIMSKVLDKETAERSSQGSLR